MKFLISVSIFLSLGTFVCTLEILDQLKTASGSFYQQVHTQTYSSRSRIGKETEGALPDELSLFELAVNDVLKDIATLEQSFNSVSVECQQRMPTTPEDIRNKTESAFYECGIDFYHELLDAQTASEGFMGILYGRAIEESLNSLDQISRNMLYSTSESRENTIGQVYQDYIQKKLEWDNIQALELVQEESYYKDKMESVKTNLKNCLLGAKGVAGVDIGDIFISLWDC